MLTPEQIEAVRLQAEALTRPVVEFLMEDIARRIAEAGQLTSTAQYQIWRAQNLGLSQKEIQDRLKKLLNVSEKQIKALLTQSAKVGYRFDLSRLPAAEAIPFEDNTVIQQIVSAAVELAQKDFSNITQTLGMVDPYGNAQPLQKAYQQCMDFAFEKVITGAEDMNSAVRKATKNLADMGVRVIDYESGVHRSIEAATRGCVMGGLGLMQEKISQQNHDSFGANGWEISAHAACAPDHEPIQGKQYSDAEYEELNNSLARRIGTLNCGHAAFPILLGVSTPQYTEEELAQFKSDNAKGIDYEGRHYSMYEATQQQRKLERTMRKQKNRILVDEATGDKEKLQIDQIRLQRLKQEYNRFSKAAGLRTQQHRAQVAGFGVKQAAGQQTAKKQIALIDGFQKRMEDLGYQTKGFSYYIGDAETLNQMETAFARMAKEFPGEAKGITIRLSKSENDDDFGWYMPDTRTIHYNRSMFKDWPKLQADYAELVKTGHFPTGTDARACFYHEFGHAVWYTHGGGSLSKPVEKTLLKLGYGYGNTYQRKLALKKELSRYSTESTNPAYQEVIAESFAEWYTSSSPRRFCTEFLKEVKIHGNF